MHGYGAAGVTAQIEALALADWRRRIHELYADIRRESDPARAWLAWRAVRERMFREHPQSPIAATERAGFAGLPHYDYDPTWRLQASLVPLQTTTEISDEIGADGSIRLRPVARTRGLEERLGRELTLYWIEGYGGGLFLPFRDATAGSETYGGGRYLYDSIKGADLGTQPDGRLVLDFNFAYHPSCCYSAEWVCPLAPPENQVPAAIRAGERLALAGASAN